MYDNSPEILTFAVFTTRYCERQQMTVGRLREILLAQKEIFQPEGWMLLECAMLDSSRCGMYTILPYGPNNRYKTPPTNPMSPRGLASDMSQVVALVLAENVV